MDLPRHAGALLGDRAPELGEADRAPDADEQQAVREQAEEVALGDEVAREAGREDVVELGEQRQRGAEREPAVEILASRPVADPEAEHREQREQRQEGGGDRQLDCTHAVARRVEQGQPCPESAQRQPDGDQRSDQDHEADQQHPLPRDDARRGHQRCERDQRRREHARGDRRPGLRCVLVRAAEHGQDRERERPDAGDEEAGGEEQVEHPPFDREADAREDRDDRGREHDGGVEHEPSFRQVVGVAERRVGQEERRRRPEQGDEQQLADEPALERVLARFSARPPNRQRTTCR